MAQLSKGLLFNPKGDDSLLARELLGGSSTNIFNLNNVKYSWAIKLYKTMLENFWIPEKISLVEDNIDDLTEEERRAFKGSLGFLTFLDSIQTNNISNIADYITAPEVKLALAVHQFQEAIHSQSYAYIFESTVPSFEERESIYNFWREDKILLERNSYIAGIYQDFLTNQTEENYFRVIVANYILEGLYFYNGFSFFYNLASRKKMIGTSQEIKLINRDELTHIVLFQHILKEIKPKIANADSIIISMFKEAVKQELTWSNHILKNILGVSESSTENYTKHLANRRLKNIGLAPLFENVSNPYKHLEKIADVQAQATVKGNFFETSVTTYNMSSALSGWDEI